MLTIILVILGVVIVAAGIIVVLASGKPDAFAVERSAAMDAPPERIFPLIDDFRNWRAWSPWETIDPELSRTYSGAPSGVGSAYAWKGNKAGEGRMEIVETAPPNRVALKLDFVKPFEAHNTVEFGIVPQGAGSHVTWTMRGRNVFMGKVMSVFMDMDKMVGKDFEKGLANLRAAAQAGDAALPPAG